MIRFFGLLALPLVVACGPSEDELYSECIDAANLADISCRCDCNEKLRNCTQDCATGICIEDCTDKHDNCNGKCDNELVVATGTCDQDYPEATYVAGTEPVDTGATTTTTTETGVLDCPDDTTTGS